MRSRSLWANSELSVVNSYLFFFLRWNNILAIATLWSKRIKRIKLIHHSYAASSSFSHEQLIIFKYKKTRTLLRLEIEILYYQIFFNATIIRYPFFSYHDGMEEKQRNLLWLLNDWLNYLIIWGHQLLDQINKLILDKSSIYAQSFGNLKV